MEEMICEEKDLWSESFLNIIDFANILINTEHSDCLASFSSSRIEIYCIIQSMTKDAIVFIYQYLQHTCPQMKLEFI